MMVFQCQVKLKLLYKLRKLFFDMGSPSMFSPLNFLIFFFINRTVNTWGLFVIERTKKIV
jgi:hypothetical protein